MHANAATTHSDYLLSYDKELHNVMSQRTITGDAAFLSPHLRSDMRLLDCGAGPGTITLGLAEAVAPGEVVGIDISSVQIERASSLAAERGVTNVRFEEGDILALPFEDASFDVAFAHTVLMHLRDPVAALREMRRVVRPGGIVAARDHGFYLAEPRTPELEQFVEMMTAVRRSTVGRPTPGMGFSHRGMLLEAGLTRVEGFADVDADGTTERLRANAAIVQSVVASEGVRRVAAGLGYDDVTQDRILAGRNTWAERPDAMVAVVWSAAIGWVA
jgi:SAM-dependent methyltransferase